MGRLALLLVAALALIVAPAARAQTCKAPPGTAAVDEYCETIPAAGGDTGAGDSNRPTVKLPAGTAAALAKSTDGQALDRLLGHDPTKKEKPSHAKPPAVAPSAPLPKAPSDNPLDAVRSAISSGPTLGGGFVAVLLAITLLMLGWGWVAYRRRED